MIFLKRYPRLLPPVADLLSLRRGAFGAPVLDKAVHPQHFGTKAFGLWRGALQQTDDLVDGLGFGVDLSHFLEDWASPQGPIREQRLLAQETLLLPAFGCGQDGLGVLETAQWRSPVSESESWVRDGRGKR